MIRRKLVKTRTLTPGMKIDQAIIDRLGRVLVARGAQAWNYERLYSRWRSRPRRR